MIAPTCFGPFGPSSGSLCRTLLKLQVTQSQRGFHGLGVSALAFGTQVRGFKPGRSRRIFQGEKIPQGAFLRKGSKTVGPVSLIYDV
jgi:hypothetical protein